MNNFSFKAYILLVLMMCVGAEAWADGADITVKFSEGDLPKLERQAGTGNLPDTAVLFNDVFVTGLDTTISGCLIVPGRSTGTPKRTYTDSHTGETVDLVDFYGCVVDNGGGTLKLSGRNRLDSETYYFRKDYEAAGDSTLSADLANRTDTLWAYTFTGWYIENSTPLVALQHNLTHVPAQTVFQPGDVITPDILARNGVITSGQLNLVALWGKCCFVRHGGTLNSLGNDPINPCTLDYKTDSTTKIADKFRNYDPYMQVAMLVGTDSIRGSYNDSYYSITYKSLQPADGDTYEMHKVHGNKTDYFNRGNWRIDNIYLTQNFNRPIYNKTQDCIELTARLNTQTYNYLLISSYSGNGVYVGNGGNVYSPVVSGGYNNAKRYYYVGRNFFGRTDIDFNSDSGNGEFFFFMTGGYGNYYVDNCASGTTDTYMYFYGDKRDGINEYNPSATILPAVSLTYRATPHTIINGCSNLRGTIVGGAREYYGSVQNVDLQIYNSTIKSEIYGGGHYASVPGQVKVKIKNTTVKGNVFGCAMGATSRGEGGSYHRDMNKPQTNFPLYYLQASGSIPQYTVLGIQYNYMRVANDDSAAGNVNNNVRSYIYFLSVAESNSIDIDISDSDITGNVYGGGKIARITTDCTVKITNSTIGGSVYGGGDGITKPASFMVDFPVNQSEYTAPNKQEALSRGNQGYSYQHPNPEETTAADYITNQLGYHHYGSVKYNWTGDTAVLNAGGFDHLNHLAYSPNGKGWGDVQGSTNVTIIGGTVKGSVYGGGNAGRVGYNSLTDTSTGGGTTLTIDGTLVKGNVFGGCSQADVGGSINMTVSPSTIVEGSVYSGNNTSGTIAGDVTSKVKATVGTKTSDGIYGGGYGASTNVKGSVDLKVDSSTVTGDVYGGSALGNVNATYVNDTVLVATSGATTNVTLSGSTVTGDVYGGGLGRKAAKGVTAVEAKVFGPVTVNFNSGSARNIFGCNNLNGAPQSTVTVNIASGTISENVYGGGNLAAYAAPDSMSNYPLVTVSGGTMKNVFGGGNEAGITGSPIINFSGGNASAGIYGGCNMQGTVTGDATVNINGGTVGRSDSIANGVFGGGYGQNTLVGGSVYVNVNDTTSAKSLAVYGDVYGGSALGNTNATISGSDTTATAGAKTHVTFSSGSVTGNIYGGGLGTKNGVNGATADVEAKVYGPVTVAFDGGTLTGDVFGCNNLNGAPQDTVLVNINGGTVAGNVYGGGNLAAYAAPDTTPDYPLVTVSGGTMKNVFGGGNQAGIAGSPVINFIGGNASAGIYGGCNVQGTVTGATTVNVNGGTVGRSDSLANVVFGGGLGQNTLVNGSVYVSVDDTTSAKSLAVYGNVYGGSALGNTNATVTGGVTAATAGAKTHVTLGRGSVTGDVYGGGLGDSVTEAKVYGPVIVAISCDTLKGNVFGCNNLNGAPQDSVFVNINGGTVTGNVYGGGNLADAAITPVVNINDCDVSISSVYGGGNAAATGGTNSTIWGGTIGNAFGGGNGTVSPANVNGNSSLTIHGGTIKNVFAGSNTSGTITGTMALNIDQLARTGCSQCPQQIDSIYGGGNQAEGKGATITIGCGSGYLGNVFGGAKAAKINGKLVLNIEGGKIDNVFGGNDQSGEITDSIIVNINTGTCDSAYIGNVYGGGNQAPFKHNTQVNLITGKVGYMKNGVLKGGNVFGGGYGARATISGNTEVNLCSDPVHHPDSLFRVLGSIYGGGDLAAVQGNTTINLTKGIASNVFGGGNKAEIKDSLATTGVHEGNTTIKMNGTAVTIGNIYGGGNEAGIDGDADVQIISGTVNDSIYGGCNTTGTIAGNTLVTLTGGTTKSVFGGGYGQATDVDGNVDVKIGTVISGTPSGTASVTGDVYGGSALGNVNKDATDSTHVTLISGTVTGNIYGGGLGDSVTAAKVRGPVEVTVSGGMLTGNVFGCNNLNGAPQDTVLVNINGGTISKNVYGGGNLAAASVNPVVTMNGGSAVQVFGGGLGTTAVITGNPSVTIEKTAETMTVTDVFGGGDAAAVTGNPVVDLKAGTVTRVFGGGNQAAVTGTTTVNEIGAVVTNIYAGGNGDTTSNKAADINGTAQVIVSAGSVSAGVYGGCNALGTINKVSGANGNTIVTINGGSIGTSSTKANIHGGGYGAKTNVEGSVDVTVDDTTAGTFALYADVYGGSALGQVNGTEVNKSDTTRVTLTKGTVNGDIYGGGLGDASTAAKVWGPVKVTVTAGQATNVFGCNNLNGAPQDTVIVDINGGTVTGNVYGGGNLADAAVTPAVNINDCSVNIGSVYGGGNAAATSGTNSTIWGGTIGNAFGGGNGIVSPANVNGNSSLTIHGGTIRNVFAGSNTSGTISGTMALNIDQQAKPGCSPCPQQIDSIYGGGNQAEGKGATITIGCGAGYLGNVFGGAKAAKINGKLVLNIKGGKIDNVFGGNDQSGEITDSIIVNINNGDCASAYIGNVYGGGNYAPFDHNTQVNLITGKVGYMKDGALVGGNVFGGGYGARATISGNTEVNLKSDPDSLFKVLGSIYGGGDLAAVQGNTTINLTKGTAANVFGGGNKAEIKDSLATSSIYEGNTTIKMDGATVGNIYGGGNEAGIDGNADVQIISGTVNDSIYGGCNTTGTITGNTLVTLTGGTMRSVFGGGYGQATGVSGSVDVKVGNVVNNAATGTATITGDVYGGSALGNVNNDSADSTLVTLISGTVTGNIYGGGLGQQADTTVTPAIAAIEAKVNGKVKVTLNGGTLTGNAFGCNNRNGAPQSTVTVLVDSIYTGATFKGNIYGGGNQAAYSGNPVVTVSGGTVSTYTENDSIKGGNVFGGGLGQTAIVTGTPQVLVSGGTVTGTVYGGGDKANVQGGTTVKVTGADTKVNGSVFGGGNNAAVSGTTNVQVGGN